MNILKFEEERKKFEPKRNAQKTREKNLEDGKNVAFFIKHIITTVTCDTFSKVLSKSNLLTIFDITHSVLDFFFQI